MRCSALQNYNAHHVAVTHAWVQGCLSFQSDKTVHVHVLCALFSGACGDVLAGALNNKGHNTFLPGVLDAVLASYGVAQQDGMFYGVELQAGMT